LVASLARAVPTARTSTLARALGAWLALPALASLALPTPEARAADEARVVALHLEGAEPSKLEAAIVAALPEGVTLVTTKALDAEAAKKGHKGALGAGLDRDDARRAQALERFGSAARELGARAVVLARAYVEKGKPKVRLVFLDVASGEVVVDQVVDYPTDRAAREAALESALASARERLAPPKPEAPVAPPPSTPAPPKPAESPPDAAESRARPHGGALLVLDLSFQLVGRTFEYNDALSTGLRRYEVVPAPMLRGAAELYPAASTKLPVLRDLGVYGVYENALATGSATRDGAPIGTTWLRGQGGLRLRVKPLGDEGLALGARGGFSYYLFALAPPTAELAAQAPSVEQWSVRGGLDLRVPAGPVAFELGGGYHGVVASWGLPSQFRGNEVGGIDLSAAFAVPLPLGLEARLAGEYQRYFYAFRPEPGDPYVAGGALDQQLGVRLGLGFHH
jgi:uncharacterized protein YbjQ (UPF0145 family)